MRYEPVIGLEIHAELSTATKLFCGCRNDPFHAPEPNLYICPVCLGLPGALPVMNREALEWTIKVGLALGCQIGWSQNLGPIRNTQYPMRNTKFDRKHYFYPDLPKGYQISQYDLPICHGGALEIRNPKSVTATAGSRPGGKIRNIPITRIHLEEDTGKLIHPPGAEYSLIDYNRSSVPLLELVTEPEITSGAEAAAFAQRYQLVLRALGVAHADMEKGGMRVEVNISLRQKTEDSHRRGGVPLQRERQKTELGTKVEIKNLNSFRSVERAIEFEIGRQSAVLDRDEPVIQETRGWDEDRGETFTQRVKETAADYRYFPEPDLPPITIGEQQSTVNSQLSTVESALDIKKIRAQIPEMPWEVLGRLTADGVTAADAERLIFDTDLLAVYDQVATAIREHPRGACLAGRQVTSPSPGVEDGLRQAASLIVNHVLVDAELITRVATNQVPLSIAKKIQEQHQNTGESIATLLNDSSANSQLTDATLGAILDEVLASNPAAVADYRAGKAQALSFLVGAVMAKTRGAADPGQINQQLRAMLETEGT